MTIGEKIRAARKEKKLTQAKLCGDKITRNMLSAIECGHASPSLETAKYIADKLELPLSYLLDDDADIFLYEKNRAISKIRAAFKEMRFEDVIFLAERLSSTDDEISYALATAYFEISKARFYDGALLSAVKGFAESKKHAARTIYDTSRIECEIKLFEAICRNIQSPLLEFDAEAFEEQMREAFSLELYKYTVLDKDFSFKHPLYRMHMTAKALIKERKYLDALTVLKELETKKSTLPHNAFVMFSVYADMENCYKQLADFEGAYRYSSKRLSMIEGFKS